eukprot:gene30243-39454_t
MSQLSRHESVPSDRMQRMKGMKIRDEFICPITYELMREPVVASDGHTYEKSAIEKWLKSNSISPRNGEPMDTLTLPNINLKKLIQDIINEGGAGFYTKDISDKERTFEVRPEKVLILECLGPPESEWYLQSFQVSKSGCIGGRKQQLDDMQSKDIIMFKDITVSRRHFEITHSLDGKFCIRDLGSAGGTFLRLPYGDKKQLHPGMIVLLGKHQFTVSSIDDAGSASTELSVNLTAPPKSGDRLGSINLGTQRFTANDSVVAAAEGQEFDVRDGHHNSSEKYAGLTPQYTHSHHVSNSSLDLMNADAKIGTINSHSDDGQLINASREHSTSAKDGKNSPSFLSRKCTLTCCAPDGSPLQGQSFVVGPKGAHMGRKQTNDICLFVKVIETDEQTQEKTEKIVNVDTAISAEHARVEFDETSGSFFISDGTPSKPSTNGTWYRLSGPHQESPPNVIAANSEVLIGTVRFQVRESMTICEHKLERSDSAVGSDLPSTTNIRSLAAEDAATTDEVEEK